MGTPETKHINSRKELKRETNAQEGDEELHERQKSLQKSFLTLYLSLFPMAASHLNVPSFPISCLCFSCFDFDHISCNPYALLAFLS